MKPYYDNGQSVLYNGDCRSMADIPDESIQCVVTSPPYWGLRDYNVAGQIGLEPTVGEYVAKIIKIFREAWRVLKKDGTLWLNLGDSYCGGGRGGNPPQSGYWKQGTNAGSLVAPSRIPDGLKSKDLVGIPWRVAFALQAEGWYLRQDIIWAKPNPMPESVTDRCTKSHEYLFLLSKNRRYYYDQAAIKEPAKESSIKRLSQDIDGQRGAARVPGKTNGAMKAVYGGSNKHAGYGVRVASGNVDNGEYVKFGVNKRSVWVIATAQTKEAHFATFPEALVEPCILAGSRRGDTVLDPFAGSGTTLWVAQRLGRKSIGYELKEDYCRLAIERIKQIGMVL